MRVGARNPATRGPATKIVRLPNGRRRRGDRDLVVLEISVSPKGAELLDRLLQTGLFGASREDAGRRLIERALEGLIAEGVVE